MPTEIIRLSLNDLPIEHGFEDFISAHLLLGGYVLDRSIRKKEDGVGDLFEVDIVTHLYNEDDEKRLVEIKSKKWNLDDVFKEGGQLRYLGMCSGAFIVQQKIDDKKFVSWQKTLDEKLDVKLVYVGLKVPTDVKFDLSEFYRYFNIIKGEADDRMLESVRFSYIAERCMKSRISKLRKTQGKKGLEALWDFSNAIQDISFFNEDPIERLHRTFALYKEYNHLSARLDYEFSHGSFPDADSVMSFESDRVKDYLLNEIDYLPVNYSLYLEHRLRMYIIQSCVEYLVLPKKKQGLFDKLLKNSSLNMLSGNISLGIQFLSKCKNYKQYPLMWQIFTYMMGGFILLDLYDEEISLLEELSGVPKDEIDACFRVYDVLFPTDKSWMRQINRTHIKRLNFMPAPLMGIGANFRREYYCEKNDDKEPVYEDLKKKLSNDYTLCNLKRWNSAAFDVLKSSGDLVKSK